MEAAARNNSGIGLIPATSLVVGNMIGSGIFLLPAALAAYGGVSILGWILSGIGAIFIAVVFSRLSRLYPKPGGPYAYTRKAYGDFAGFIVAWGYWISIWCSNAAISVAFISYLSFFIPGIAESNATAAICAISMVWILTGVNIGGVKSASKVQVVTVFLKVIPLVLLAIIGIFFIDISNLQPFNRSNVSNFDATTAVITLTLFAFLGIESATIPSHEVRNASQNIPRATIIGTIITLLVYLLSSVVVMGVVNPQVLINSEAPYSEAAKIMVGPVGGVIIGIGALASTFGALNGWIIMQGQIPYAIAKDKLFPGFLAKTNKVGAPVNGLIAGSIMITVLILTNYTKGLVGVFTFSILLATLTVLVPYLFCSFAEILILRKKQVNSGRKILKSLFFGIPAFLFSVFAVVGAGMEIVFYGFLLIILGIPFYAWVIMKRDDNK